MMLWFFHHSVTRTTKELACYFLELLQLSKIAKVQQDTTNAANTIPDFLGAGVIQLSESTTLHYRCTVQ